MYSRFAIGVYFELESRQVEPVVSEIETSPHQSPTDTLTLPIIMHAYSECTDVCAPWFVWKRLEAQKSNNLVVNDCDQVVDAFSCVRKPLPP